MRKKKNCISGFLIRTRYRLSKNLLIIKNWVSLIACSVGFASCKTFGKQPKHPCFGAKPPTGTRGGSPSNIAPARMPGVYAQRLCTMQSQQSIHSPSPRGRGLGFRQGCRYRTPKGFARTQSPQSVLKGIENLLHFYKNGLFLQAELSKHFCPLYASVPNICILTNTDRLLRTCFMHFTKIAYLQTEFKVL